MALEGKKYLQLKLLSRAVGLCKFPVSVLKQVR